MVLSDSGDTGESGKSDIKFYGKVIEYTSGPLMCDALEEQLGDKYNFEMLQVDWGNLDKVIRTGIASNEPCDVYNVISTSLSNFKDQVVDLTPYLDENNGEWRKCFEPAALEMCNCGRKGACNSLGSKFPDHSWKQRSIR